LNPAPASPCCAVRACWCRRRAPVFQAGGASRDLRRVLKCEKLPRPEAALARLHAEEARHDLARRENRAEYDLHRHIMLLIAILAETAEIAPRPSAGRRRPGAGRDPVPAATGAICP
jgi:hypothetical protein